MELFRRHVVLVEIESLFYLFDKWHKAETEFFFFRSTFPQIFFENYNEGMSLFKRFPLQVNEWIRMYVRIFFSPASNLEILDQFCLNRIWNLEENICHFSDGFQTRLLSYSIILDSSFSLVLSIGFGSIFTEHIIYEDHDEVSGDYREERPTKP